MVADQETHSGITIHDFERFPTSNGPDLRVRGHDLARQPVSVYRQAQNSVAVDSPQIGQDEIRCAARRVFRSHSQLPEQLLEESLEGRGPHARITGHVQDFPPSLNMASGAALTITEANTQGSFPRLCHVWAVPRWIRTSPALSKVSSRSVTATTSPERMML